MSVEINSKIIGYSIVNDEPKDPPKEETKTEIKRKTKTKRPELLWGVTTKVKTPECNIYGTINCDPKDNKPLEVFFSSSHLESAEWVSLTTRLVSAMLRSDDSEISNLDFIAKEFIKTESPGGYLGRILDQKKGRMVNGVIPHLGFTLLAINKRLKAKAKMVDGAAASDKPVESAPPNTSAGVCPECHSENTSLMDNCLTCLDCAYSKCG